MRALRSSGSIVLSSPAAGTDCGDRSKNKNRNTGKRIVGKTLFFGGVPTGNLSLQL
jgi:hypothetical protein